MRRLARLIGLALWHATSDPPPKVGEQMASLQLYGTSKRGVQAAPKRRPSAVGAAPAVSQTRSRGLDGCTE